MTSGDCIKGSYLDGVNVPDPHHRQDAEAPEKASCVVCT